MKWFEHPENKATGYWLTPPYDNVMVGCDPRDGMTQALADSFDVFVNVSDSECNTFEPSRPGQHMHWYPVNEMGQWNLSYLFWLKKVMDHHHAAGRRIYLHCHAGAYRSPSAAVLWLQSRGHSSQEALTLGREQGNHLYSMWESFGNIPRLKDRMFELMRQEPTWSLNSILHRTGDNWNREIINGHSRTLSLLHQYFWFYYRPKWWIKDVYRKAKQWLSGCGWHHDGACTHIYARRYFWAWPNNAEPKDRKCTTLLYGKRWSPETRDFTEENKS